MRFFTIIVFLVFTLDLLAQISEKTDDTNIPDKSDKVKISISASVHTDIIYDAKQMDPDWYAGFRPSKIPVYPTDPGWGTNGKTYYSLQQSTFKFDAFIPVEHKWDRIRMHVTFDLYGTGIHAGETVPRFRTGWGEWGPFIIGKEWSTFVDLHAFPNNYDWWGPSGMALMSSPMIRYTNDINDNNKLELALEVPGSDIDPGQLRQIDPSLIDFKTKEVLPDFISRYTHKGNWGYIKGALLLRQLSYEILKQQDGEARAEQKFGWALNFTSNFKLFKERGVLKLQTVFGHGYAGYNNDGGVEITPDENFKATVPFQRGFVIAYDHHFNKISTSFTYSETNQDNSAGQLNSAFHRSKYFVAQIIYPLIENTLTTGLNYQYGKRINKNRDSADDYRIMFSVRYLFKWDQDDKNN
ncbi:MAG: hypothetical protein GXO47_01535 [Chlorobi bacterium]|nr:hypothetical protein [Chlorobiota bacterium]